MTDKLNDALAYSAQREPEVISFLPEQVVGGKYKVLSFLGRGGVGSVYLVEHLFLKQRLALKVLDNKQVLDDAQVRRFQIEAKAAYSLDHPNLVKVQDFGVLESDRPYLVMEYIEGVNLTDFIKTNGAIDAQLATLIFAQLCLGMAHAHQKSIIHRDIKPSNVMLVESLIPGTPGSAKIVDFGIAKLALDEGGEIQALTRTGEIFGSPLYMSPEQCSGGTIDQRTDIYSLGCALFEALTGTPPFVGSNPLRTMMLHVNDDAPMLREASLGTSYPAELERIVAKLLKKNPAERYQNFDDVARDLNGVFAQGSAAQRGGASAHQERKLRASKTARKVEKIDITPAKLTLLLGCSALVSSVVTAAIIQGANVFNSHKIVASVQQNSSSKRVNDSGAENGGQSGTESNGQSGTESGIENASESAGNNDGSKKIAAGSGNSSDQPLDKLPEGALEMAVLRNDNAHDAFSSVTKICSEVVPSGDHRGQRKFTFPSIPIGYVVCDDSNPRIKLAASGTQYLPANLPLMLSVGGALPEAFNDPSVFRKVNPNEFAKLSVIYPADRKIEEEIDTSLKDEAKKTAAVVSAFSSSDKLTELALSGVTANRETLDAMDRMQGLKRLVLFAPPKIDLSGPAHPFFQRLTDVRILDTPLVSVLLREFYGSKNLSTLTMALVDVGPDCFSKLNSCSKLHALAVLGGRFSPQWITDLKKIRTLSDLSMRGVSINQEQLQQLLAGCPQIKRVGLVGTSFLEIAQSKKFENDPRVQFSDH